MPGARPPPPAGPQPGDAAPEAQLKKLKDIYEQGLITEQEYNDKRGDILPGLWRGARWPM